LKAVHDLTPFALRFPQRRLTVFEELGRAQRVDSQPKTPSRADSDLPGDIKISAGRKPGPTSNALPSRNTVSRYQMNAVIAFVLPS
jgi:hypothetical protein